MNALIRLVLTALLIAAPFCCIAEDDQPECLRDAVHAHVLAQFATFGPLSEDREYFGFIYVHRGEIGSAIAKGHRCRNYRECAIDTSSAAPLIPKGAKVLGEWHTHPHQGSATLSLDDVRGAYNNRHIRCYAAFYSKPSGEILRWDPDTSGVILAMASRVPIGNYSLRVAEATNGEVK